MEQIPTIVPHCCFRHIYTYVPMPRHLQGPFTPIFSCQNCQGQRGHVFRRNRNCPVWEGCESCSRRRIPHVTPQNPRLDSDNAIQTGEPGQSASGTTAQPGQLGLEITAQVTADNVNISHYIYL